MAKILLDYFFPIATIEPTPQASTSFLKKVLVLVKKKSGGVDDVFTVCTSQTQIAAVTDNLDAQYCLNGGLSSVTVLTLAALSTFDTLIEGHESEYYTVIVSSDFSDANVTSDFDAGEYGGVVAVSSADDDFLEDQAVISNRVAFHTTSGNKAKNLCYAFGKMLSNALNWRNQQYITMPFADDVSTLGDANLLFDAKISFVISDSEFGNRLALFAAGGKAIVAPYITRNLQVDLQSKALSYISGNQPAYTKKEAALLQDELEKVIDLYQAREWIEDGTVEVTLEQENFVASGDINISEPNAMWRIFGEMRQTL